MNKLYKKIYEAINTGIQKALILDQDVSMNYQHKKIDNNYDVQRIIDNIAEKIINEPSDEHFNDLLNYINNYADMAKYKVKDIKELITIYNRFLRFSTNTQVLKNIQLNWIDSTNIVTLILKNGTEIACHEYNHTNDIVFVKLKNIGCPHDIYYPIYYQQITNCQEVKRINNYGLPNRRPEQFDDSFLITTKTKKDFKGWEHTYEEPNIKAENKYTISLYDYANETVFLNGYKSYIPSIGELFIINEASRYINYIFRSYDIKNQYITESWNNDFTLELSIYSGRYLSSSNYSYYTPWYFEQGSISRRHIKAYTLMAIGYELFLLAKPV